MKIFSSWRLLIVIVLAVIFVSCQQPKTKYTITVNSSPASAGSVALSPSGGTYDSGTDISVLATPATWYLFSSWSGGAGGTANPMSITVNSDLTLTAVFVATTVYSGITMRDSDGNLMSGYPADPDDWRDIPGKMTAIKCYVNPCGPASQDYTNISFTRLVSTGAPVTFDFYKNPTQHIASITTDVFSSIQWNFRDDFGRLVPAGIYRCYITFEGEETYGDIYIR